MSNYEATRYDFTGANLTGIEGIPTATIVPWSSSSVPSGFLECDGSAVSRSNVPNLADNVCVGKSNNKALASTGGANTVQSTGNVGGSTANATLSEAQLASHTHGGAATNFNPGNLAGPGGGPVCQSTTSTGSTGSGDGHSHNMSATFTGDSTSVLQPYLAVIYIIKT